MRQIRVGPMANFAYVLRNEEQGVAAVVDPGFDAEAILSECAGAAVEYVLITHGHPDHVQDAALIRERTGARIVAARASAVEKQIAADDGDILPFGTDSVRVVATPGHQADALCFVVPPYVATGDTLFVGECGRADLPGSDARELWRSLLVTLRSLDPNLIVLPGHDYGPRPTSTLAREFAENYTLRQRTEAEFVRFVLSP
jgi:glyoxylase-like metal-dependent hydrolase (beta-lactamase superfamily II)